MWLVSPRSLAGRHLPAAMGPICTLPSGAAYLGEVRSAKPRNSLVVSDGGWGLEVRQFSVARFRLS